MIEQLHFLRPDWFYAFIPFCLLAYIAFNHSVNSVSWKKICDAALLPHILISKPKTKSRLLFSLVAFAVVLSIIAAAGPVWKKLPTPVFRDQSSLVIAVDLSHSMDAADIKPTRLKRAKLKLIDILKQRKSGQTALIVYAANAFTVTPLTSDTATIINLVAALDTNMMPAQGSNVSEALNLSSTLLSQAGDTEGDILLISDSIKKQDFSAITDLANKGHRLSILGVGTLSGGPIVLENGFLEDASGAIVIPKLDVALLQKAALTGHGLFVGIQTNDDDIKKLSTLFTRNRTKTESVEVELTADLWHEEGPWLLLIVLPLVALLSRRGVLLLLAAITIPLPQPAYALEANALWLNDNQRAMQHFEKGENKDAALLFNENNWKASAQYRNGEYEQALESFEQSTTEPSSTSLYNKANTLAKLQRYEEAISAYEEALSLDPNNEDAIHNRDIVKQELQKQKPDENEKDEKQEDKKQQNADKDKKDKQDDQQASDEKGEKSEDEKSQDGHEADKESEDDQQDKNSKQSADNKNNEDNEKSKPEPKDSKEEQAKENDENLAQNLQQKDMTESAEDKKATDKWLKRIVDDPGGLLRRKFKYQYQNMPGQKQSKQPW